MFDLPFDIGGFDVDDIALAAVLTDPELNDYNTTVVEPTDAIKRESASRKKGGALLKQNTRDKLMAQEAFRRQRNQQRAASMLIDETIDDINLRRFGRRAAIGAGAAGLTGMAINAAQGDTNGNLIQNPLTEAAILSAGGAGLGGIIGARTTPVTQQMPLAYPRSSVAYVPGGQAVRNLTPAEIFNASRRRGMRGAAVGAGAGALIALTNQFRGNDPGQQNVYI